MDDIVCFVVDHIKHSSKGWRCEQERKELHGAESEGEVVSGREEGWTIYLIIEEAGAGRSGFDLGGGASSGY